MGEAERVLEEIKKRGIRFVQLWFTDLLGNLKSIEIPTSELSGALHNLTAILTPVIRVGPSSVPLLWLPRVDSRSSLAQKWSISTSNQHPARSP